MSWASAAAPAPHRAACTGLSIDGNTAACSAQTAHQREPAGTVYLMDCMPRPGIHCLLPATPATQNHPPGGDVLDLTCKFHRIAAHYQRQYSIATANPLGSHFTCRTRSLLESVSRGHDVEHDADDAEPGGDMHAREDARAHRRKGAAGATRAGPPSGQDRALAGPPVASAFPRGSMYRFAVQQGFPRGELATGEALIGTSPCRLAEPRGPARPSRRGVCALAPGPCPPRSPRA